MELRDIEIFLMLAEELHFGRTAERLRVSPARVSQVIKKQERSVGTALFERNSRNVRLTPVGEQLRDDLRVVYRGLRESMERASLAARGETGALRVGMLSNNARDLRHIWDTFRAQHPQWSLRIRHNPFVEPLAPLRRGEVDMLITWLPVEELDITVGPVAFTEPSVLMIATDHRLASRERVTYSDLGLLGMPSPTKPAPDHWADAFAPLHTPTGNPVRGDMPVANLDETIALVSAGEVVSPIFAHAVRWHPRPDVVYLPIKDARIGRWALVWRTEAENSLIRALAQVVRDLGPVAL